MEEEFEDTKGVIRIHISKKIRQHNGQKKKVQKDKQRSTKHTHKTKDRITQTPLKTGGELGCSWKLYFTFHFLDPFIQSQRRQCKSYYQDRTSKPDKTC